MTEAQRKWEALKARGSYTIEEIEAVDEETPWADTEPAWWLEMMDRLADLRRVGS